MLVSVEGVLKLADFGASFDMSGLRDVFGRNCKKVLLLTLLMHQNCWNLHFHFV